MIYIEQRYCSKCVCVHWVEVLRSGKEICRGEKLSPHENLTHYAKHLGRGYKLLKKRTKKTPEIKPAPIEVFIQVRESVDF